MGQKNQKHHHHILPTKVAVMIGGSLLFLTAITVWISHVDLDRLNFIIAMAVASVKALLVALFFMNLIYDRRENAMIFGTSFVFLAIFLVLTGTDIFFRGDVYVKGPILATAQAKSKLKNPWISTPELASKGKELFQTQCVSCHGAEGKGDGPAAAALNPRPRDFTATQGWKNGRKPTQVFKTLKEGLPPSAMASFVTLPSDDRWALVHYVLSLAPNPEADTPADFARVGIDPTKAGGGEKEEVTIPIELAMERIAVPEVETEVKATLFHRDEAAESERDEHSKDIGKRIYQTYCVQCHGPHGEGGIKVRNLGVSPVAFVTTRSFQAHPEALKSQESFTQWVVRGLPGELMPSVGHLNSSEMGELYQFVKSMSVKE